jgi:hypothetical protein
MRNTPLRTRAPYWHFLKPLFRRFGIELKSEPTEAQVQHVIKNWLEQHGISLLPKRGFGIDIADFEFSWEGLRIAIEAKGHSRHPHDVQKIIEQVKRYLKHNDLVILIVHSPGLMGQIKRLMSVVDPSITGRVILLKINEIDSLFQIITEKIEEVEKMELP